MEQQRWTLTETFYFPVRYGAFREAENVRVTPGFTEDRTEDAVRLNGIYHIAAQIVFDEDKPAEAPNASQLFIDDVEVEDGKGYFEHAVPLHVDLPSTAAESIDLKVAEVNAKQTADGALELEWVVQLENEDAEQQSEELTAENASQKEEEIAQVQTEQSEAVAQAESTSSVRHVAHQQEYEVDEDVKVDQVYAEMEDFLAFIAELEDGVTRKLFHSNNVFVETESQAGEQAKQ